MMLPDTTKEYQKSLFQIISHTIQLRDLSLISKNVIINIQMKENIMQQKEYQSPFDKGDIDFYLEMSTFLVAAKKEGRPPKKNFRFKIIKKDILSSKSSQKEPVQQQLFDDYEEINNLTEIETELKQVIKSTDIINRIIRQIKDKEVEDNNFSEVVLTKVRNIRTKYAKKGTMEWGKVLLQVLADDFSLGDLKMSTPKNYAKKISWPDTIAEKIKLMQNSWEICDKAIRDYPHLNLNQEKVTSILGNEF